jgi:hypothetical protein
MRVFVEGLGLCGPGLNGWAASLPVLAGRHEYAAAATSIPPSLLLPANERRRAAQIVKIALAVGTEALTAAGRDPAETAAVFTSSGGDGETIHEILNVLASPQRELSPTRFHNSVHNAASGYWSIATGSTAASTSLCCHDDSFTAGLLEAVVQAVTRQDAVVLIAYDVQYPAPINALRPIGAAFAVALVLSPAPTATAFAEVELALAPGHVAASEAALPALEMLTQSTPAARCLTLLTVLARRETGCVRLNYLDDMALTMNVAPIAAERNAL